MKRDPAPILALHVKLCLVSCFDVISPCFIFYVIGNMRVLEYALQGAHAKQQCAILATARVVR